MQERSVTLIIDNGLLFYVMCLGVLKIALFCGAFLFIIKYFVL